MNAQNVYVIPACVGKEKMNRESVYKQLVIDEGVKYEIYKDHLGSVSYTHLRAHET